MLLNIDPLLGPELLKALRAMGHRQDIAIVDANFPCEPGGNVIRLDGVSATTALAAVLSVLPVEVDEEAGTWRMIAYDDPGHILPIFDEFAEIVEHVAPHRGVTPVEPDAFKAQARDAYVTVVTGERRLYGGIIVRKGVIPPIGQNGVDSNVVVPESCCQRTHEAQNFRLAAAVGRERRIRGDRGFGGALRRWGRVSGARLSHLPRTAVVRP